MTSSIALWFLLCVGFLLPYSAVNAWDFIPATGLILFCAIQLRPGQALSWLGLRARRSEAVRALLLTILLTILFRAVILRLSEQSGLRFDTSAWSPWLRTRPVFQVLNEEMLFRAVLLQSLLKRAIQPWKANLGTAAFFTLSHLLFYPLKDGTLLNGWALWNLFVFSIACNALYLRFRHIAYGYAIHLGWNLTRFGGDFFLGGVLLSEGAAFNLLEGSPWLALGITPIAGWLAWKCHKISS